MRAGVSRVARASAPRRDRLAQHRRPARQLGGPRLQRREPARRPGAQGGAGSGGASPPAQPRAACARAIRGRAPVAELRRPRRRRRREGGGGGGARAGPRRGRRAAGARRWRPREAVSGPVISTRPRDPARRRARSPARPGSPPRSPRSITIGRSRAARPGPAVPGRRSAAAMTPPRARGLGGDDGGAVQRQPGGRLAHEPRPADARRPGHHHDAGAGRRQVDESRQRPRPARRAGAVGEVCRLGSPWDDRRAMDRVGETGAAGLTGSGGVPTGFEDRHHGRRLRVAASVAGAGPPLLLLHGYPQTRACWHRVAPALAERFTVVVPPTCAATATAPSRRRRRRPRRLPKRAMAADMVAVMRRSATRGSRWPATTGAARVAHRMALDHPAPSSGRRARHRPDADALRRGPTRRSPRPTTTGSSSSSPTACPRR